jgi:subtilisin family serine protease
MNALEIVNLTRLMRRTSGRPEIKVAVIDGPVFMANPQHWGKSVHYLSGHPPTVCEHLSCAHGTFVASILAARRGAAAPAICPDCTLLVRTIFSDVMGEKDSVPSATPKELAAAIVDVVDAGARVLNMSIGISQPSTGAEPRVEEAMDYAARRGAIPVVAAGNQGTLGSSVITRHFWALPVVGCDSSGMPTIESNLGRSIGRRGLRAPGENITGFGAYGKARSFRGTSAAAPFVAGAIALLWSEFPEATANDMRLALANDRGQGGTLVPPLLNAWRAYTSLAIRTGLTVAT